MFGQKTQTVESIIATVSELQEDGTVPKNVKEKIQRIIETLKDGKAEVSMRIDKARQILDEVSEDANIQSYTRTQLWNIVSMLEKM